MTLDYFRAVHKHVATPSTQQTNRAGINYKVATLQQDVAELELDVAQAKVNLVNVDDDDGTVEAYNLLMQTQGELDEAKKKVDAVPAYVFSTPFSLSLFFFLI